MSDIVLRAIEPTTMAELKAFATDAAKSGFFGAKTPEQAMMIAMAGRDLGLSYTQALRAFHVIEGKPSLSADGAVAVCLQHHDLCEYFREVETTADSSTWETKRKGDDKPRRGTFTIDEAKAAGLVKPGSGWAKYPRRMLAARAKLFLARDTYPEILVGLYDPDELRESAPERVAPPAVRVVVPDSHEEMLADAMHARIRAARDAGELRRVAAEIKAAALSDAERAALRTAYEERRAALVPPAVVTVTADGEVVEAAQ